MAGDHLEQSVKDIPALQAVFIIAMPDCLLFDAWVSPDLDWQAEEVSTYFGDLFRANREGLKALKSWSADMQVTIEAPEHLILLRELTSDFVCASVFDRGAALGMVRLYNQRLIERITASLPAFDVQERPRGVRVMDFLSRYAPDPHAVLLRASLRSGIAMTDLEKPAGLSNEQVQALERTACDILGLDSLNL